MMNQNIFKMDKCRLMTLGGVSAGLLLVGIILSLLCHFLPLTISEGLTGDSGKYSALSAADSSNAWMLALPFIIPAILGLVAAVCNNRCLYILSTILSVVTFVIMALFLVIFGIAIFLLVLGAVAIDENCNDDVAISGLRGVNSTSCNCKSDPRGYGNDVETGFKTCESLTTSINLVFAIFAFFFIGSILLLAQIIAACVFCCQQRNSQQGLVITQQEPMVPLKEVEASAPPPYNA